jgi:chromosome segregation ATPase
MAQPQQNVLVSLINAHTDTIDAQKQLMAYMKKHINDLEQAYVAAKKELDNMNATVYNLNVTIEQMKKDNIQIAQMAAVNDALNNLDLENTPDDNEADDPDRLVTL